MAYAYTYGDVLSKFTLDFFNSILAIKNPPVLSQLSLKRVHKKPFLHKIEEKIGSLTAEQKDELISEFLSILPNTDSTHAYTEAENVYRKKRFAKYDQYFSDIELQFKNMKSSEKKLVVIEAFVGIESNILKIRNELSTYAVESEDTEPYMLTEQILSICQSLVSNSIKLLKSGRKKDDELQWSMFLVLMSLLNLEAVRRGKKKIESLYDLVAILTSAMKQEVERKEISRDAYEVFNLAI